MTCEHCGAPMRADRERGLFVCDYCESQAIPPLEDDGVLLLGPAKEKCPTCAATTPPSGISSATLSNGSLASFNLRYCEHCRGMLIGMDDFQPLIAALRSHRDAPAAFLAPRSSRDADRTLECPKCGAAMDDHPYGGGGNVNVDTCEDCDVIWLDGGELRKIAAAADRQVLI
jgi:Zn-finger nucleic acid-binding protein